MLTSKARQIKRLTTQLEAAQEQLTIAKEQAGTQDRAWAQKYTDLERTLTLMTERYQQERRNNDDLKKDVRSEQVMRISAQRGLVRYMQQHQAWMKAQGNEIGYDPDQDSKLADVLPDVPVLS